MVGVIPAFESTGAMLLELVSELAAGSPAFWAVAIRLLDPGIAFATWVN